MNNKYNFQFIRIVYTMIFVFFPQILIFFVMKYYTDFNIFLKILMTPIIYILFNIYLYKTNHFNIFHETLKVIRPVYTIESSIHQLLILIKTLLLSINLINKLYVKCKVKILLFTIQFISRFIPGKEMSALELELQNGYSKLHGDYMHILHRNRYRRASMPNTGIASIPLNTGIASIPSNTGIASIPLNTGIASIPSNTGIASIPSNTGIASIPLNTGIASIPNTEI
jgi:hypothetical protein